MKNNTMIPYNAKKDLETNYYTKTEVELLLAGGAGGSTGGVTLAQTTGSGTDVIMSQKAVSDRIEYTNSNPVPTAIGGIKAGTTFNKTPIIDILDSLLYPYQNRLFVCLYLHALCSSVPHLRLSVGVYVYTYMRICSYYTTFVSAVKHCFHKRSCYALVPG